MRQNTAGQNYKKRIIRKETTRRYYETKTKTFSKSLALALKPTKKLKQELLPLINKKNSIS